MFDPTSMLRPIDIVRLLLDALRRSHTIHCPMIGCLLLLHVGSEGREVQTKFVVAGRLFGEEPIIVRGHSDLNAKTNACACMLLLVACMPIRFNFL